MNNLPKIIRLSEVIKLTSVSRSTIYKQIKNKTFPKPVSMGERAVAFLTAEVEAYIDARMAGYSEAKLKDLITKLKENRKQVVEVV